MRPIWWVRNSIKWEVHIVWKEIDQFWCIWLELEVSILKKIDFGVNKGTTFCIFAFGSTDKLRLSWFLDKDANEKGLKYCNKSYLHYNSAKCMDNSKTLNSYYYYFFFYFQFYPFLFVGEFDLDMILVHPFF